MLRDNDKEFPIEYRKYKVPADKEEQYIRDYYKDPTYGHPSITKTVALIRYKFTFLGIRTKVTKYIKKCDSC